MEYHKYRNHQPSSQEEMLQMFAFEVQTFKTWAAMVSPARKMSFFWECDYEEQFYIDVLIEDISKAFPDLSLLPTPILDDLLYMIARNHEQGNIIAWTTEGKLNLVSLIGIDLEQFRFLAKQIVERGEPNAKFQVAAVYSNLEKLNLEDILILESLLYDEDCYTRRRSLLTLAHYNHPKIVDFAIEKIEHWADEYELLNALQVLQSRIEAESFERYLKSVKGLDNAIFDDWLNKWGYRHGLL